MTPSSPTLSHGGNGLPEPLCLYTNLGISFVLVGVFLISDELLLPLNILYFFLYSKWEDGALSDSTLTIKKALNKVVNQRVLFQKCF